MHIPSYMGVADFRANLVLTDGTVTGDGAYVDDVGFWSWAPRRLIQLMSGTSMATPHVTGAVALCAAQYPPRPWRSASADPQQRRPDRLDERQVRHRRAAERRGQVNRWPPSTSPSRHHRQLPPEQHPAGDLDDQPGGRERRVAVWAVSPAAGTSASSWRGTRPPPTRPTSPLTYRRPASTRSPSATGLLSGAAPSRSSASSGGSFTVTAPPHHHPPHHHRLLRPGLQPAAHLDGEQAISLGEFAVWAGTRAAGTSASSLPQRHHSYSTSLTLAVPAGSGYQIRSATARRRQRLLDGLRLSSGTSRSRPPSHHHPPLRSPAPAPKAAACR